MKSFFLLFYVFPLSLCGLSEYLNHAIEQRNSTSTQRRLFMPERDNTQERHVSDLLNVHDRLNELRGKWQKKMRSAPQESLSADISNKLKKKKYSRVRASGDTIHQINKKANLTKFFYQGDIALTSEQVNQLDDTSTRRNKRQAYKDVFYPQTIWNTNIVSYYYDASATQSMKTVFEKAVKIWSQNTCINFQNNRQATNRIRVMYDDGCWSYVGRVGGEQPISLGNGCDDVGTAVHELGHALGFFHTQSRVDRDTAISIIMANIEDGYVDQFNKEPASKNYNYGMPYDYGSVMQYGATSASSNRQRTMVAKQLAYQDTMGSDKIAFYDISMMNEHYGCKAMCPAATSAKCQNEGFPSSRNCSVCICPTGYGGTLCNQRPSGCGSTLTATPNNQDLKLSLGTSGNGVGVDFTECNYWIQAPAGKRIQLTLAAYSGAYSEGCIYGGLEIKTNQDIKRTGYRICSSADIGTVLTSSSNLAPIIFNNRYSKNTARIQYKYVDASSANAVSFAGEDKVAAITTEAPKVCSDSSFNCNVLSYFGYCNRYNVREHCKWSCNAC